MLVRSVQETIHELYARLQVAAPFYYSRYGDGDFEIMLGRSEMQHAANPELARELRELFQNRSPEHMLAVALHQNEPGMVDGLFKAWTNPEYFDFVRQNTSDKPFWNAIALHYAGVFNPLELRRLFDLMQERRVYFVGNAPMDRVLPLTGPLAGYVRTPYINAYTEIEMTYSQLRTQIVKDTEPPVVLLAAGMASRAIINRLIKDNVQAQVIDLGSVVDFAIGNQNRTWIKLAGKHQLPILLRNENEDL